MERVYRHIDPEYFQQFFSSPTWYLELREILEELLWKGTDHLNNDQKEMRQELVSLVSELLRQGSIALGQRGINWDAERLPVDTAVIHHSATDPDVTLDQISALGLLRLYAPVYRSNEEHQHGQPIWSGHFFQGRQTFIAYHYLVRQDGSYEQVLNDGEIGWQAGKWAVNCRSIAVCFIDRLSEWWPSKEALETARGILQKYPDVQILGHREVNPRTTCPRDLFEGEKGWGKLLGK